MKRNSLIIVGVIISILLLSACSNKIESDINADNTNNDSIGFESDMNNFLKTITLDTAEYKGVCGADLTWFYKDNVLVIKGNGEMTDYKPLHFKESTVPWNELMNNIAIVIIQDGVTYIGTHAFSDLTALAKIVIAESVNTIGDSALTWCENLTEISLSEGLQVIGERAFQGCIKLDNIEIPSSVIEIRDEAFRDIKANKLKFKGNAPKIKLNNEIDKSNTGQILGLEKNSVIYYSGSGFDSYIESSNIGEYNYTWIKD